MLSDTAQASPLAPTDEQRAHLAHGRARRPAEPPTVGLASPLPHMSEAHCWRLRQSREGRILLRPICDRFRTQRIASLPLRPSRCPTMCLWHAERVSATNPKRAGREARRCIERDARRGGGISVREAADRQRRSRADRTLTGAPNEPPRREGSPKRTAAASSPSERPCAFYVALQVVSRQFVGRHACKRGRLKREL